ncbi:proton-conducting transporter membrane subunit [Billgrantia aerodenitrificans]|uniref:NADH-quinone oxidoreductase subunit N n=1 Tax=Billgrantia aerodenitrificans TaxID=2733483 RepID=A0ABS9ASB1_9GAMM|nr:proton-conducting transporter membrane subunit [Halomonas aerodenitrificans]MCE8024558.1 NADH-quinone oxidoreductase subunit N [Halomonas aerodenitrificans]
MTASGLAAWTLPAMIFLPLGLSIAAFLGALSPGRQVALGLPVMLMSLALSLPATLGGESIGIALGNWPPPLGIAWHLDFPALTMLIMTAVVAGAASLALLLDPSTSADRHLWPLWWMMWAGLNALLLSQDLFNLYVTLELVTLAGVGLVARSPHDRFGEAALRYLMASLLASLLYLLGTALIYGQTGRLDLGLLVDSLEDGATMRLAAALLTLGLLIKAAVVPLHTWLPAAHSKAQAPVSAMLSAVVVGVTLFVLWRLWLAPLANLNSAQLDWLVVIGMVALGWGGVQAALQTRLKLLIAWSTLCHSGYALLLLGLDVDMNWFTPDEPHAPAFPGGLQLLLAHGLAKGALFLAAGAIVVAHDHDRLSRLAGDAGRLPLAWLAMALAGLSLLGIPPTGGFFGKWWLLQGALAQDHYLIATVVLLGTFFTAACLWRLFDLGLRPEPRRAAVIASRPTHGDITRRLSWLALGLAALAWGLGPFMALSTPLPMEFTISLALDATGLAFLLPALCIWPLVLWATYSWRDTFPAANRLLAMLASAAAIHLIALLAADLLTFYTGAALLSLLGWAMVQHDGHQSSRLAGLGYLVMLLLAEVAMLAGLALIANASGDLRFASLTHHELPPLALGCMAFGLAIKAGVIGVHAWLPLAHPVAPPMASAVLSGLMIKLGLLGALRLLPLSDVTVAWGPVMVMVGLVAAVYAALRGIVHDHAKVVLAWSSVSQMGLLTALLGLVLYSSSPATAMTALLLLATTHSLAKASLFLGAGMANRVHGREHRWVLLGMLLPALALAGVPPTGGVLVKSTMESALTEADGAGWLLSLSGIATGLLMLRLLWLLWRSPPSRQTLHLPGGLWLGWATLAALPVLVAWGWQWYAPLVAAPFATLRSGLLEPSLALGLAAMAVLLKPRLPQLGRARLAWRQALEQRGERGFRRLAWMLKRSENRLQPWPAFGIALGFVSLGMGVAALLPG